LVCRSRVILEVFPSFLLPRSTTEGNSLPFPSLSRDYSFFVVHPCQK
jgi:hypothetical protein